MFRLDPAGPLFESQDPRARLDQSDASFVDVIHSNGENLILGGLGSSQPMGHVDFYPNGGRVQKGCSHLFVGAINDFIWSSAVEGRSLCNHRRAYKFFIDSVSPRCHFPAFPCESYEDFIAGKCFPCTDERTCGNMGYYADRSTGRGQLYLITRDEEPFCAHQYYVKIETSSSFIPIKSYGKIQITLIGESFLNETFMMTRKEDEEMTLGDSIARILVPHPILSQPTRIEILYTAYSGWLSSGLTQWRLDKVTLMDSFGKASSVCKNNLILESGVPVILPLYPGNCNLPKETFDFEAEDRLHDAEDTEDEEKLSSFNETENDNQFTTTTQVAKVESNDDKDKKEKTGFSFTDIFSIPWRNENENSVIDNEAESSRAFNTKVAKLANSDKVDEETIIKEIVEPILRPHASKNASSKVSKSNKDFNSVYGGDTRTSEWVPKDIPIAERNQGKRKREDESRVVTGFDPPRQESNPLENIATTVQFLPQRLARMFEQAEKYTRDTILPLVSTYTPKFISDFIAPKDTQPKYVPLSFEEPTTKVETTSIKIDTTRSIQARNLINSFDPPPNVTVSETGRVTTPYTHIQKIRRKGEAKKEELVLIVTPEVSTQKTTVLPVQKEVSRKTRDDAHASVTPGEKVPYPVTERVDRTKKPVKAIYVDLPVSERKQADPLDVIISTVQFIPDSIGKMFQQAERFTRENILPLVNNFTPRFISDMIAPRQPTRYIPLKEEPTSSRPLKLSVSARHARNKNFDPPPRDAEAPPHESTTAYTHIQKIAKRSHKNKAAAER
ncbi:hypothetical protein NQ318_009455 [Aromia moschata]|uniref:Lipase domain-containing protein n=1 Tax=Aromia moschata TaxID=1265417 RepID=A0AAV8Z8B7_9CUCU|nr:hypothetical protein NQ318_009455 [Aromia moschata]